MDDRKRNHVLTSARATFLRYGFRRVSMADIAAAAGVSRPALYLLFKNKEEIFVGVFLHWVEETVAEIVAGMAKASTVRAKLACAFEIWSVRPFDLVATSPDAKELIECTAGFARTAQREGYARFEETITLALEPFAGRLPDSLSLSAGRIAHLLAGAVQGFKQSAESTDELRAMIGDLLDLTLAAARTRRPAS